MPTALQTQRAREASFAREQELVSRLFPGNPMGQVQQGPGMPNPGAPSSFAPVNFQLPQLQLPQLPDMSGVGPAASAFLTANPGPGFDTTGMSTRDSEAKFVKNAGMPGWPSSMPDAIGKIGEWISSGGKPAAPAAGPGSAWDFAIQTPNGTTVTPTTLAAARPIDPVAQWMAAQGHTVTSGDRTEAKQKELITAWEQGGRKGIRPADNSWHLQPGHAIDVVPKKGGTIAQLKAELQASGMQFTELLDEGDHLHVAIAGADPFHVPQLAALDPKLAGTAPMPNAPAHLNLPDAPQMEAPPAQPLEEQLPVQAWMDSLKAHAPKAFDAKAANEGRIGKVLAGLAQGAASVDARQGVGAVLAAMGAGAATAQATWAATVKADKKETEEAGRLFELGLAQKGIDWSVQNRAVRQRNLDRQFQDQTAKMRTTYDNKLNQYRTDTQELLANNGLDNSYLQAVDGAHMTQWRTGLQLMEGQIAASNAQLSGQQELDLKRFLWEDEKATKGLTDGQAATVSRLATSLGMNPSLIIHEKDKLGLNALDGLGYMTAGNKPAAISALGREIVLGGHFNLFNTKQAGELKALAQKDPGLAAEQAGMWLNQAEADPARKGTALALAKILAGLGRPLGTAFVKYATPTPAATGAPNAR